MRVLKTPEVTSPVEFLFTETGARFLQNSCSKQQLKHPGRLASVVKANVQAQYFMLPNEYLRPSNKQNYDLCSKTNIVDKLSSRRRRSVKKMFLKISQISQENTYVEGSFK